MELGYFPAQVLQKTSSFGRDAKRLPRPGVGRVAGALEPAVRLHAQQRRVERPRAEVMAMSGKLPEQPPAPDLANRGVVQDVDLPDPEADLAVPTR